MSIRYAALACALVAATLPAGGRPASAADDFFAGKVVRVVIPAGPGGVYGLYAQSVGPYLRKHVPGHPDFVATFMPGGGGIKAANYLANVAPRDGTEIALPHDSLAITQLLTPDAVKYDVRSFRWLGTVAAASSTIAMWHAAAPKSVEEAKQTRSILGATGRGSYMYFVPRLMNALLGTKFEIVTGYKGISDVDLAMERGEVQGRAGNWMSFKTAKPEWLQQQRVIQIVQLGYRKSPDLPDVPFLVDLATDDEQAQMLRLVSSIGLIGRGFAAPPGTSEGNLGTLRAALERTLDDPGFIEEAKRRSLEIDPIKWSDVEAGIALVLATPPDVVNKLRELIGK